MRVEWEADCLTTQDRGFQELKANFKTAFFFLKANDNIIFLMIKASKEMMHFEERIWRDEVVVQVATSGAVCVVFKFKIVDIDD